MLNAFTVVLALLQSGTHCRINVDLLSFSALSSVLSKLSCLTLPIVNVNTLPLCASDSPATYGALQMCFWFDFELMLSPYWDRIILDLWQWISCRNSYRVPIIRHVKDVISTSNDASRTAAVLRGFTGFSCNYKVSLQWLSKSSSLPLRYQSQVKKVISLFLHLVNQERNKKSLHYYIFPWWKNGKLHDIPANSH